MTKFLYFGNWILLHWARGGNGALILDYLWIINTSEEKQPLGKYFCKKSILDIWHGSDFRAFLRTAKSSLKNINAWKKCFALTH